MVTPFARPAPRRRLRNFLAIVLIACTLAVFYVNAKNPRDLNAFDRGVLAVSAPVQAAATRAFRVAQSVWRDYLALVHLKQDKERLAEEVILLEQRVQQLREVALENQRLRKLLDFTNQQGRPFRTARVVGYDPTSHFRTIRIDRGSSGGVARGMPVVTAQGVVGRILRVWARYSDVLLLTDPQSSVDCLVQRTRARGTVEGVGNAALRMKYLLRLDEVQEGDLVITSGFDSIFPSGLLIGTVSGLRKQSSGVFQEVQILPAADLTRVEEVVILDAPPAPIEGLFGPPEPEGRQP